jgi:glycosyltransferase involved in cell wall biosynthesis
MNTKSIKMKLTIVTINYNNATGLKKTMDSVFSQTDTDFEYIIVDGASTDISISIIKEYEHSNIQHFYWISEPDKGIYNAMNKGIQQATGEYIYFLNSGDWFADTKVVENIFSAPRKGDVLYGNYYYVTDSKSSLYTYPKTLTNGWFYAGGLCHQAVFVKTEHQKKHLFEEKYRFVADWKVLFTLFVLEKKRFEYLNFPISYYTLDGFSSKPENIDALNKERLTIFKEILMPSHLQTEIDVLVKFLKITDSDVNIYVKNEDRVISLNGRKARIMKFIAKLVNKL